MTGIVLGFFSCKNQDSLYKEYLVDGGLVYPAPAKDAAARPGNKRIEILWKNSVDPKVVKSRIFWNNYTDSAEVALDPDKDIIRRIIDPLEEDTYSFFIRTYDAEGHSSVPVEVTGTVYGKTYQSTLTNRILKNALYSGGETSLRLEWAGSTNATETGIELNYTDIQGSKRSKMVETSETSTLISDFKVSEPLFYKTVYKPDSMAIDLFYAPTVEKQFDPIVFITKNTWTEKTLPGDAALLGAIYGVNNIWNNNTTDNGKCYISAMEPLHQMFTWDLGVKVVMNRFKMWPRAIADDRWARGHPKIFELYGSIEPNPDGSLDNSWIPLGKFECVKPSPGAEITQEDIDFANAGIDFRIMASAFAPNPFVAVRYLRFRTLETFNLASPSYVMVQEISIWGELTK